MCSVIFVNAALPFFMDSNNHAIDDWGVPPIESTTSFAYLLTSGAAYVCVVCIWRCICRTI